MKKTEPAIKRTSTGGFWWLCSVFTSLQYLFASVDSWLVYLFIFFLSFFLFLSREERKTLSHLVDKKTQGILMLCNWVGLEIKLNKRSSRSRTNNCWTVWSLVTESLSGQLTEVLFFFSFADLEKCEQKWFALTAFVNHICLVKSKFAQPAPSEWLTKWIIW